MIPPDARYYEDHPSRSKRIQSARSKHGLVCWGHDAPEAFTRAVVLAIVDEHTEPAA